MNALRPIYKIAQLEHSTPFIARRMANVFRYSSLINFFSTQLRLICAFKTLHLCRPLPDNVVNLSKMTDGVGKR